MCILKIRDNFLRLFETDLASEIKFSVELKICESKGSFNDTLIIIWTGHFVVTLPASLIRRYIKPLKQL